MKKPRTARKEAQRTGREYHTSSYDGARTGRKENSEQEGNQDS